MNQFSKKILTPSVIAALIASNFVFLFPSSIANGQSSSTEIIDGTEEYNLRELSAIFLLFLILIGLLTRSVKCSICRMNVGIWDYDHKDGNRGINKASNCQALCPICYAKKAEV